MNNEVVPERVVEKGDRRNNYKGRNNCPQNRNQNAGNTAYLIADHNRAIDSDSSGRGLGNRHHVKHFLFVNPVQFIHKFLL